jgi:hypothetical protein
VFFFKKKQKEMKVVLTPNETGVEINLQLLEGKEVTNLSLPLRKSEIEELYKIPGFITYVAWEELFDNGLINTNILLYENYYELIKDDNGIDILKQLGLPTQPIEINGELQLKSLPQDGDLKLELRNSEGKFLNRIGNQKGALFEHNGNLFLLPQPIFTLKQAIQNEYENGYQKVGVCQELAKKAGIQLENFLEKES